MTDAPAGSRNAICAIGGMRSRTTAWRISSATRDVASGTDCAAIGEHDIPFGHWAFLRVLWDQDGLTQKELSDAIGVTEPTTFAAVKALIDKGYITRRHNTGNKRKFYVYLTSEGAALRDILVPLAEKVNRVAVADIPPENINLTRETLLKMIENLAAEDENGD